MKTNKSLSELFEQARNEVPEAPASILLSLVERGKSSPLAAKHSLRPRRIKHFFNPLKFLVMITPIVIITAGILLFNTTADEVQIAEKFNIKNDRISTTNKNEEKVVPEAGQTIELKQPAQKKPSPVGKNPGSPIATAKSIEKDTVFDGIILDLSKEELTRLGFMFDDEGYYYLNKLPDGSKMNFWSHQEKIKRTNSGANGVVFTQMVGSFGFASGGFVNQANKCPLHENDFYPVLTTGLNAEDLYPIDQIKGKVQAEFDSMKDTLVPVLFSRARFGGYQVGDKLVWFKVSEAFFARLSGEQIDRSKRIYLAARTMKNQGNQKSSVHYSYVGISGPTKIIRLNAEVLRCMGFKISANKVEYEYHHPRFDWKFWIDSTGTVGASPLTYVGAPKLMKDLGRSLVVYGITDNQGKFSVGYNPQSNNQILPSPFESYINLSLPIQIDEGNIPQRAKEAIFWVYPSEKFFSCLPPEIAEPMKKEFNYHMHESIEFIEFKASELGTFSPKSISADSIKTDPEPVPCVYFTNLCESLPGLDYVNLYPNPATDQLNVDLVLGQAKKIRFRVFDLGGRLISDEETPLDFPAGGQHKHQLDISNLQGGFYLLVMTDEEGARLTRRFVKN